MQAPITRPDETSVWPSRYVVTLIEEAEHLHEFVNSASPEAVSAGTVAKAQARLDTLYEIWHSDILPTFGPY